MMIVQGCTSTKDNIINNKENNITKDNIEITKSSLYDTYKERIKELLADYQQESDYIAALDKHPSIEHVLESAEKHIPMLEIEDYRTQLTTAQFKHEQNGWNITLDMITDDMMQNYHTSNIFNVKTPTSSQQFKTILNNTLGQIDLYISTKHWDDLAERIEKWITHQWERSIISYDIQQEAIEKVYSKLAS